MQEILSAPPHVRLVNAFPRALDVAVATARTCYSAKGIVMVEDVGGDSLDEARRFAVRTRRDDLARDLLKAGHHTTFQHAHFQFAMSNVSRQFLWSFLHAHPFYNSEQVSQRYVEVKPGNHFVPRLAPVAQSIYERALASAMASYQALCEALSGPVAAEYLRIFPARRQSDRMRKDVKKKAQEAARYVLPVATFAYLYHTINGITLLRYYRLCNQYDAPLEQRLVIKAMVDEVLRLDPDFAILLEEPLPLQATPEYEWFAAFLNRRSSPEAFAQEFDAALVECSSRLVDYKVNNEATLAQAVREVLGLTRSVLTDDEAIDMVLNPARNRYLGESLNLTSVSKIARVLVHPNYTFQKKLSHAADSQDQRHRMTPASRPLLLAHVGDTPDYITPTIVRCDERASRLFAEAMERAWAAYAELLRLGVDRDLAIYVLPNALTVRMTESTDLASLWHKCAMRLCYNAQEEIWNAAVDEAAAVREVNPRIGRWLLPPCGVRYAAGRRPICPEGSRFCGVKVWTQDLSEYRRVI